jgi:acetolactate synthase-1/2/3 large subunit
MSLNFTRREALQVAAAGGLVTALAQGADEPHSGIIQSRRRDLGLVAGKMTGAQALVETLMQEGVTCVFGIPGAQNNELWDTMKSKGLDYLLVTHEFSAAAMADGYARSTGRVGVLCTVPGPGVTNSLTGIGETLLDSIPLVCIACGVAGGKKYKPFQVHELPEAALLQKMTKGVFEVAEASEIPSAIRQAFLVAQSDEPGPAAVIVPYPLFIASYHYHCPPLPPPDRPLDEGGFQRALAILANRRNRVGIYAGLGCMDYSDQLVHAAEILQAPVATSVSGKGVISDHHPLAVGWGYGPQGTRAAEGVFKDLDVVLAIGVRFSEVSTAFYAIPSHHQLIHVDINKENMDRVVKTTVCVHADAGQFLSRLAGEESCIRRAPNSKLTSRIAHLKQEEYIANYRSPHGHLVKRGKKETCGVDPMAFVLALRKCTRPDALVFVDVTATEHYAAEVFQVEQPRTYFNPTDNQVMGWSIPAALGAQRVHPHRQTITITGDGCFLMAAQEISTAAREHLPVKFFIIDDGTFHLMQAVQKPAYLRTTATVLAQLDYQALAKGFGVSYQEIGAGGDLDAAISQALSTQGPVLVRVAADYGNRSIRWIDAAKSQFTRQLTAEQKMHFMTRLGYRAIQVTRNDD